MFIWSDLNNANCREYAPAVIDVQPNTDGGYGHADVQRHMRHLQQRQHLVETGRHAGSRRCHHPQEILATGEAIGSDLFNAPLTANEVAWSPVDDRVLYHSWTTDTPTNGIYMTTVGGGAGTQLVRDRQFVVGDARLAARWFGFRLYCRS